ncbi:hypothetical protein HDV00_009505 [Rhizophlyctis rosea]|nr:hypothetical protein HDV00_009505 [Rhizophlyctis rosea]
MLAVPFNSRKENDSAMTHPSLTACADFLQPFMHTFTIIDYNSVNPSIYFPSMADADTQPPPLTTSTTATPRTLYAFHGTSTKNIPLIFAQGFKIGGVDVRRINGDVDGPGIYLSRTPRIAKHFAQGGKCLIVAEVRLIEGVDQNGVIVVVRDREKVCPVAIVHPLSKRAQKAEEKKAKKVKETQEKRARKAKQAEEKRALRMDATKGQKWTLKGVWDMLEALRKAQASSKA